MDMQNQYTENGSMSSGTGRSDAETMELDTLDKGSTRYGASGMGGSGTNMDTGEEVKSTVRDTVNEVQETAGRVASQAQETASRVIDQVRDTASMRIEDQKQQVTRGITNIADVVRRVSTEMQDQGPVAEIADKAAWHLERASTYLENHDVRDLVVEVERFARRQPVLFLGGGLLLGMLGARFLKSSGKQAEAQRFGSNGGGARWQEGNTEVETFTTQGDHTVEGYVNVGRAVGSEDDGEQVIHSTYRVPADDNKDKGSH